MNNFGIMGGFGDKLNTIKSDYAHAFNLKDYTKADEILNINLRGLLQEQYTYLEYLGEDAKALTEGQSKLISQNVIDQIFFHKEKLEQIVFENWDDFRRDLKSGELKLNNFQIQNAN